MQKQVLVSLSNPFSFCYSFNPYSVRGCGSGGWVQKGQGLRSGRLGKNWEGLGKGLGTGEDLRFGDWGTDLGEDNHIGREGAQGARSIGKSFQSFHLSPLALTLLSRGLGISGTGEWEWDWIGSGNRRIRMWDRAEWMVERVIRGKEGWIGLRKGGTEEEDWGLDRCLGLERKGEVEKDREEDRAGDMGKWGG